MSVSWVTLLKRGSVPSVFAVQSDPRTLRHGVRRIPLASAVLELMLPVGLPPCLCLRLRSFLRRTLRPVSSEIRPHGDAFFEILDI